MGTHDAVSNPGSYMLAASVGREHVKYKPLLKNFVLANIKFLHRKKPTGISQRSNFSSMYIRDQPVTGWSQVWILNSNMLGTCRIQITTSWYGYDNFGCHVTTLLQGQGWLYVALG